MNEPLINKTMICMKCNEIMTEPSEAVIVSCCKSIYHNRCCSGTSRCNKCGEYYMVSQPPYAPLQPNKDNDFDIWSYGIFRGFNWTYFTVAMSMDMDINRDMDFILWSSNYNTMRKQMMYFFDFIAARLQMSVDDMGITVTSNLLKVYIPGMIRGLSLRIVYRDLMDVSLPIINNVMYHDGNTFVSSTGAATNAQASAGDSHHFMNYNETPEQFFKRTGVLAVPVTFLLSDIFQDWTLVCEISGCNTIERHIKKFNKYINTKVTRSSSAVTKVIISSPKQKVRIKTAITANNIYDSIMRVVYSQRTISGFNDP